MEQKTRIFCQIEIQEFHLWILNQVFHTKFSSAGRSLEHFEQALSCSLQESDEQREGKKKFPRLAEKEMSSLPKPEEGGATARLLSPEQLGRLRARVYFELSQVSN